MLTLVGHFRELKNIYSRNLNMETIIVEQLSPLGLAIFFKGVYDLSHSTVFISNRKTVSACRYQAKIIPALCILHSQLQYRSSVYYMLATV